MKKRSGVILVAHGSKRRQSNEEFIKLCEAINVANNTSFEMIMYAFLEFEAPSITSAMKRMQSKAIEKVFIYPYFLNTGKHVSIDIPEIIATIQGNYPKLDIEILTHFGASEEIVSIITSDLGKAL